MPECKLRYIGATVAVAAAAAPAREKENNQERWRAFFPEPKTGSCATLQAHTGSITCHSARRRVEAGMCAYVCTTGALLFCGKGAFKGGPLSGKTTGEAFISWRAFSPVIVADWCLHVCLK